MEPTGVTELFQVPLVERAVPVEMEERLVLAGVGQLEAHPASMPLRGPGRVLFGEGAHLAQHLAGLESQPP